MGQISVEIMRLPGSLLSGNQQTNPATKGRVVYSALGHLPESYDDPNYRRILTNAIHWAGKFGR